MAFYCPLPLPEDGERPNATQLCYFRQPERASIALTCRSGQCLYRDGAPPPVPRPAAAPLTAQLLTLLALVTVVSAAVSGASSPAGPPVRPVPLRLRTNGGARIRSQWRRTTRALTFSDRARCFLLSTLRPMPRLRRCASTLPSLHAEA